MKNECTNCKYWRPSHFDMGICVQDYHRVKERKEKIQYFRVHRSELCLLFERKKLSHNSPQIQKGAER